jgi:hypothetical protein
MLAALMLAAVVKCADPSYCPSEDQLRHAYVSWFKRQLAERSEAFSASGDIALFHPLPVLRVTGARCGKPDEPTDGAPPVIRCTASFHYAHRRERQTLLLARTERAWAVHERPVGAAR